MGSKPHPTDPNHEAELERQGFKEPVKKQPAKKPASRPAEAEKKTTK